MNISHTIRNIVHLAVCLLCVAPYTDIDVISFVCGRVCVHVLTLIISCFFSIVCVCCYHLMVNKDYILYRTKAVKFVNEIMNVNHAA